MSLRQSTINVIPKRGELQFKVWLTEQAERLGIKPHTLYMRIQRGKEQKPKMRVVNPRVMFVTK